MTFLFPLFLMASTVEVPAGVELYDKFRSGMSASEAKALLIDDERMLTDSCQMKIELGIKADKLLSVRLRNKWTAHKNDCFEPLFLNLKERYGDPGKSFEEPAIGNIVQAGLTLQWLEGDRVIELTKRPMHTVLTYKTKQYREVERIPGL